MKAYKCWKFGKPEFTLWSSIIGGCYLIYYVVATYTCAVTLQKADVRDRQ